MCIDFSVVNESEPVGKSTHREFMNKEDWLYKVKKIFSVQKGMKWRVCLLFSSILTHPRSPGSLLPSPKGTAVISLLFIFFSDILLK